MRRTSPFPALLATLVLAIPAANVSIVLYSSTFSGSSATPNPLSPDHRATH